MDLDCLHAHIEHETAELRALLPHVTDCPHRPGNSGRSAARMSCNAASPKEIIMSSKPEELLTQGWQLEAATGAHADAETTRKAIAAATDPSHLVTRQAEWARADRDDFNAVQQICKPVERTGA
jgi:hypothetical protein